MLFGEEMGQLREKVGGFELKLKYLDYACDNEMAKLSS